MQHLNDTIVALSTPVGVGAVGIIRLSGPKSIELVDTFFYGKNLTKVAPNTVHYGKIKNENGMILDECLATVFRAPRSYTKENIVELSCHGSPYILDSVIQLCLRKGARMANRGEFTLRAFLNGQLDLSQAEAVADLIASDSAASHDLAMKQMRGGFSKTIEQLRQELIDFAALIELELDFGEEDVEFADRKKLTSLVQKIQKIINTLLDSFAYGNAIKKGVPVAIIGKPNVGKSTLLNALLNEDKAIISDIAGTTRDVIEDQITIEGINFRFIDTAGIRQTSDQIERIGIQKSMEQLSKAKIVIYIDEARDEAPEIAEAFYDLPIQDGQQTIILLNKSDLQTSCAAQDIEEAVSTLTNRTKTLAFSAKSKDRLTDLKQVLLDILNSMPHTEDATVTNARHYDALQKAQGSLNDVLHGIDSGISNDFVALDIRQALYFLGLITGKIHTDDLLDSIFTRFCIGK